MPASKAWHGELRDLVATSAGITQSEVLRHGGATRAIRWKAGPAVGVRATSMRTSTLDVARHDHRA